jgi:co-chaperonin GroES (HSP10)
MGIQTHNYYFDKSGDKIEVGDNYSGIQPVEDKLLLLPDEPTEVIRGIIKPEQMRDQETMAQVRALLVAVGGNCFEDWDDPIPVVGNRVMVMKYAGIHGIDGADGRSYQICTARDITAIILMEEHIESVDPRRPLGQSVPDSETMGRIVQ